MNDIEKRIQTRDYVSPGRARMAVNRSRLSAGLKKRLLERVTAWEDEQSPVVGGEPPAASPTPPPNGHAPPPAAGEGFSAAESDARTEPETVIVPKRPEPVATLNLNAWVRVRFTLAGLTKLHAARERVVIPGDIVSRQGEWSGTLWELMLILASDGKLGLGDQPVASNLIEVLDTRTTPESESFEPDFSVRKPACSRVSTLWDDRGEPEFSLYVHSVSCTAKLQVDAQGNVRVEVVEGARGFVLPADSLDELHRQSRKRRGYAT